MELSGEQSKAITSNFRAPLAIFAGPGSGKTTTLCKRAQKMIESGISPANILIVTFTNKAANDMREKLEKVLSGSNCDINTFHSLCLRFLRERKWIEKETSICTKKEQKKLIRACVKECLKKKEKSKLNTSSSCSTSENKASPPDEKVIKTDDQETSEETKAKMKDKINSRTIEMMKLINTAKAKGHVPKDYIDEEQWIFQRYEDMKKELKFIDFNDMISLTINKLKEHQEENEKYSRRYKYILVDEYQDTNILQYDLISLLCKTHSNLTIVGDDDQSIYGWRGADSNHFITVFVSSSNSLHSINQICTFVDNSEPTHRKFLLDFNAISV